MRCLRPLRSATEVRNWYPGAQGILRRSLPAGVVLTILLVLATIGGFGDFSHPTRAAAQDDDLSVVGPPMLDGALVDAIFHRLQSPMEGTGSAIYSLAAKNHVDDAFALAVWWAETNDGAAGVGRPPANNPGGVKYSAGYPYGSDGYTLYNNYTQAASDWYTIINQRYIARGLTTVYQISHPYVGTSSSPLWAAKVVKLMSGYQEEAKQSPAYRAAHDPPDLVKTPAPGKKRSTLQAGQHPPAPTLSQGGSTAMSRPGLGTYLLGLFIVLVAGLLVVISRQRLKQAGARVMNDSLKRRAGQRQRLPGIAAEDDWEEIAEPLAGSSNKYPGMLLPSRTQHHWTASPARPLTRHRLIHIQPDDG